MIKYGDLLRGYEKGVVRFVLEPGCQLGTVCQIGDNWFYFGGLEAEGSIPEEYLANVGWRTAIKDVYNVLNSTNGCLGFDEAFPEEYDYYEAVLSESGCCINDEPQFGKQTLELMWQELGNACCDDLGNIDSPWCGWEAGTDREEIWHWFDGQYARWGGVHALMFPGEHPSTRTSPNGSVTARVNLQAWCRGYAIELESIEFDCSLALDNMPLAVIKTLVCSRADYDTDDVYYEAVSIGLVRNHDDPFDCILGDRDELDAYIARREERTRL